MTASVLWFVLHFHKRQSISICWETYYFVSRWRFDSWIIFSWRIEVITFLALLQPHLIPRFWIMLWFLNMRKVWLLLALFFDSLSELPSLSTCPAPQFSDDASKVTCMIMRGCCCIKEGEVLKRRFLTIPFTWFMHFGFLCFFSTFDCVFEMRVAVLGRVSSFPWRSPYPLLESNERESRDNDSFHFPFSQTLLGKERLSSIKENLEKTSICLRSKWCN